MSVWSCDVSSVQDGSGSGRIQFLLLWLQTCNVIEILLWSVSNHLFTCQNWNTYTYNDSTGGGVVRSLNLGKVSSLIDFIFSMRSIFFTTTRKYTNVGFLEVATPEKVITSLSNSSKHFWCFTAKRRLLKLVPWARPSIEGANNPVTTLQTKCVQSVTNHVNITCIWDVGWRQDIFQLWLRCQTQEFEAEIRSLSYRNQVVKLQI